MPSHQPLSKEAIEDIKAECFANDITYNYDVLKDWDEDKVRDYFESGGGGEGAAASTVVAPGGVDPFMKEMPAECLWRHNADKSVAVITLNRPQNKNAIDDKITEGLVLAVERIHATPSLRVVFLTGNGAMFCAGGDPKGFLKAQELGMAAKESGGKDENSNSAGDFAELLRQLNSLPVYLVGLANGSAMGGGFGLLCCCDCVYARKSAFFALSEVKLGVIPATISPYVVAKIGPTNSRRLFMTGETINVEKALAMGLVQEMLATPEEMAKKAQEICDVMLLAAPGAARASKNLVRNVQYKPITPELIAYTADQLAQIRMTEESKAGMVAVQAGKKPPWAANPMAFPPA